MTSDSRVDILQGLLERVRKNAREPRPAFLAITDGAPPSRTPVLDEAPPESVAFDLVSAPRPSATVDSRDREIAHDVAAKRANGFVDEPTDTGNAAEIENLLLQEQAAALREQAVASRGKIRFEESAPTALTTRPPPATPVAPLPGTEPEPEAAGEVDLADAAVTEPPPAAADLPPLSIPSATLPDLDSIEADLLDARAEPPTSPPGAREIEVEVEVEAELSPDSSRTRQHHFIDEATGERLKSTPPQDDEAPSSVRQPREEARAEDMRFEGFGPIEAPSEPPPESGEVPSQRRVAAPYEAERNEADHDETERRAAREPHGFAEPSGFEHEATKEVRALGRVDVVERAPVEQPVDVVVLKGEPRASETFASILDAALALSPSAARR